ncbi:uncharacterized protein RJT21DRAFT_120983 [Scheffersomyces amazonensis]|uniref:uncharacterized protein n=1 Tax=Scheffersomyces amazonensis TaxID=1078765 RepID=UPI00315D202E
MSSSEDKQIVRTSNSEPTTPLRSTTVNREQNGSQSNPNHVTKDIHLPPNELTEITKRLSQQFRESIGISGSQRSRSRQPTPTRTKSSNRGVYTPTRLNGSRRTSESFKRRRSSIITKRGEVIYGPEYAGPITIDYLRFFCKVVVQQTQAKSEPQPISIISTEDNDQIIETTQVNHTIIPHDESSTPPKTEFDQSLPLPSSVEKVLKSPFQTSSIISDEVNDSNSIENNEILTSRQDIDSDKENQHSTRPLSYLEKILFAKRAKNKARVSSSAFNFEINHKQDIDTPEDRRFVIDNDFEEQSVASPLIKKGDLTHEETNKEIEFEIAYDGIEDQIDNFDVPFEQEDQDQIIENDVRDETPLVVEEPTNDFNILPTPIVTPENIRLNLGYSPEALIQEEFTVQDDNPELSELLERDLSSEPEIDIEHNIEYDETTGDKHERIRSISTSRMMSTQSRASLPLKSVKNLVNSIRLHSVNENTHISKKKPRLDKPLSSDIYQTIQEKSDIFLSSLLSDLEAYANHRTNGKSSQIKMKDVLLYLNRIKFAGQTSSRDKEINKISSLAQNYLPLELLLQLDDSLNVSSSKINRDTFNSESESDESI